MVKEKKTEMFVILSFIFGLIISVFLWVFFNEYEGRLSKVRLNSFALSSKVMYYLDSISYGKGKMIEIQGWAFIPNENIKSYYQKVIIRNKSTKECFAMPTELRIRDSVDNHFKGNKKYLKTGFYSKISKKKIDLANTDYEVYLLYKSNSNNEIVLLCDSLKNRLK